MRYKTIGLPLTMLAAACDRSPATQPAQPIVVRSPGQDQLHKLDSMNLAIALKRAIYDNQGQCRTVTKAGYVGVYKNTDYWTATCRDQFQRDRDWAIFVGANDTVQVRLCKDVVAAGLAPCTITKEPKPAPKAG